MISFISLLIVTIFIKYTNGLNANCQYNFTKNVSYDISSILANQSLNFVFVNGTALPAPPTYYLFNLCGNITEIPNVSTCYNSTARNVTGLSRESGYCPTNISDNACSESLTDIQAPVAAYEIVNGSICYRLHDGVTSPVYSVINTDNPVLGFYMRYIQGDFCPSGNTNRDFTMTYLCDNTNKIVQEINVVENPICSYSYTVRSIYACPTQCLHNDKICNNYGACIYDATNATARCLCTQAGATGRWCENVVNINNSTNTTNITNNTNSTNNNIFNKNDNDHHRWPRWLSILLACLAGIFLCCCLLALLGLLALCRKHRDHDHDHRDKARHGYDVPSSNSPERVPIAARHNNGSV